jgi:hypothetical protein
MLAPTDPVPRRKIRRLAESGSNMRGPNRRLIFISVREAKSQQPVCTVRLSLT